MIIPMVMPQVTVTTSEVTLISWLKKPGDKVKKGEPLLSVETDKATVEIESHVDGYLRSTNYPDGATIQLDAQIAILTTTPDEPVPDLPSIPNKPEMIQKDQAQVRSRTAAAGAAGRIDISPVARKLAEANGIDIAGLRGSGPEGRIIRADVEAALGKQPACLETGTQAGPRRGESGLSAMRNAIAQRTTLSKTTIPHFYETIDVDMSVALDLLERMKERAAGESSGSPTITDLILWWCGRLLPRFPALLSSWTEQGPQDGREVSLGLVVGLEQGLIVPVVHAVDRLGLSDLAVKTANLKRKARQGTLTHDELSGGAFTVSNLGMYGINTFIAIINPPECAILALGAVSRRPVAGPGDEVVIHPIMTAALSVDHRLADGILAARFLKSLKDALEHPALALMGL